MLSISKLKEDHINYYLENAKMEYYLKGGEPPGRWHGEGAALFGLSGIVAESEAKNMYQGFSPNGKIKLVQNAGDKNRISAWDLTFNAPKSVSIAWAYSDSIQRLQYQDIQAACVKASLDYFQNQAAFSRRGKSGHIRERASLFALLFEHSTNRKLDPHLHTHAVVLNLSMREDGTTGNLDSSLLYRFKMAGGALYRANQTYLLEKDLGIRTVRNGSSYEIDGVSDKLIKRFSKRRAEILEKLAIKGIYSAKAAQVAALATRQKKTFISRSELIEKTRQITQEVHFDPNHVRSPFNLMRRNLNDPKRMKAAIERAMERITSQNSYFLECDLVRFTAEESQCEGLSAKYIVRKVNQYLRYTPEIVQLKAENDLPRYTTREILGMEKEIMATVKGSKSDRSHMVSAKIVNAFIRKHPTLDPEQKLAIRYLTQDKGSIACLTGNAGTGKTFVQKIAYKAWKRSHFTVMGVSISGKAAQGLQEETGIPSDTMCKTLAELRDGRRTITSRTIVLVDEAGMVGTRDMRELMEYVRKGNGKLLLVGDFKQLQPIASGGVFHGISKEIKGVEMKNIRRQKHKWARQAVVDMLEGHAEKVISEYSRRKLITVEDSREKTMQSIVKDWKRKGLRSPKDNLVFTSTNYEATTINRMIQQERKSNRSLGIQYTTIEDYRIYTGDRVMFCRNSRKFKVRNGHLGTVCGMNGITNTVSVRLDNGKKVNISLKEYVDIKLGYAVTTHKSQGMTVENSYILLGGSFQDREMSYVQLSRARNKSKLYIDKFEAGENFQDIIRQMNKSQQKDLAIDHEIVQPVVAQTPSPQLRR